MDNVLIQILTIIAIGLVAFFASRLSRKSHEDSYGKVSIKEKVRFFIVFLGVLAILLPLMYFFPIPTTLIIVVVILIAQIGVLGSKPGLYKDIMYASTICSLIAGAFGVVVHGM